MIRILIADDHAIVRSGLKQLIEFDEQLKVAAEAENGAQVLDLLRTGQFDLLLLDMRMPGICGEDLITRVHSRSPTLPILILSMHNEPQIAQRALRAGANGYLTKDHNPETLLAAIVKVATGGRYLDPRMAELLAFASAEPDNSDLNQLTDREFQVMRMLARGLSVNQVAEQLVISNKTVSTHKTRLMEKMGFGSTADLVKYAMTHDLAE